jgi:hypothetical protein
MKMSIIELFPEKSSMSTLLPCDAFKIENQSAP